MTVYLVHLFQTSKVFHKIFCIVTKLVEHILLSEQGRGRTFSTHGRKSTNMLSSAGKTHDPTNIMPQSLQTKKTHHISKVKYYSEDQLHCKYFEFIHYSFLQCYASHCDLAVHASAQNSN